LTLLKSFTARTQFRHVFIVESRSSWLNFQELFDPANDLVLTYDFGLLKQIKESGGMAQYVDHLAEQSFMQANNFLMYEFFRDWHLDVNGADIFRYRDVDFGFSFRIEIWSNFTFYVRNRICLEQLRLFSWKGLYLDAKLPLLHEVLNDMELDFIELDSRADLGVSFTSYFFPIHRWMHERLRVRQLRHTVRDLIMTFQGFAMSWIDRLTDSAGTKVLVFVQEYHPTRRLLQRLRDHPSIRVVQAHFSSAPGLKKFLQERLIPIYGSLGSYQDEVTRLTEAFQRKRSARLVVSNGVDITHGAYRAIERSVVEVLPESLRALDCVVNYLNQHPLRLEILIANIGQVAMLVDCVAKSRNIPSYLIINGLLGNDFLDEAKHATVINGYSTSIRDNYFKGMDNIVCLGDPRMDAYAQVAARTINRFMPTITIGASGYSPTDLNSFLAVEFKFLYEVLSAIYDHIVEGAAIRVVIKVRPNGYLEQYRQFTEEYFPGMVDLIFDNVTMHEVLCGTDLFISIYSQTLFEASCLGIPVIYHKTDREIMDPPFDGKSELVTTNDIPELTQALRDFLAGADRFDAFLNKLVMEKYVGPLDGKNLERNFDFVLSLLGKALPGKGSISV
jgi:hypothetical protein